MLKKRDNKKKFIFFFDPSAEKNRERKNLKKKLTILQVACYLLN